MNMKSPSETRAFIKEARQILGLTQFDLGKVIGKARDSVASYERRTNPACPPGDVILKLQAMIRDKQKVE